MKMVVRPEIESGTVRKIRTGSAEKICLSRVSRRNARFGPMAEWLRRGLQILSFSAIYLIFPHDSPYVHPIDSRQF